MVVFLSFIFYDKMQDERAYIRNNIFLEMKNYSLGFDDKRFHTEYVKNTQKQKPYTLHEDAKSVYILIPSSIPDPKEMAMVMSPTGMIMVPYSGKSESKEMMKVLYPRSEYLQRIGQMQKRLLGQYLLFVFIALIVALLAAWYTLRPLRSSLRLLEDFIKDIIHDLNTPLSAIILNLKMIRTKNDEIESIRIAAQTIEMLHHNLDSYIKERHQSEEVFEVGQVVESYIRFFTPLYDYLQWDVKMEKLTVSTDKQACSRIIYNLLSNACKYNTSDGKIVIRLEGTTLTIQNSSYGVKHPQRVFERFYKESERGLGIGLHIVDKLCHSLGIEKRFALKGTEVVVTLECHEILV